MEQLRSEFDQEMRNILELEREVGYHSSRFRHGIEYWGSGYTYARQLLRKADGDFAEGTWSDPRSLGRLDVTAEYYVVKDRYRPLFTDTEREIAQWRLDSGK
jgi:hypothetical protein